MFCCARNNIEMVRFLLSVASDVINLALTNDNNETAFTLAN